MSHQARTTLAALGAFLLTVLGLAGFWLGLVWMSGVVTRGVDATWGDYVPSYSAFLASSVLLIFGLLFLMRSVLRSANGE